MYVNLVLLAVFLVVVACMVKGGLWSNALMLFNVITSALLASNFADPLAQFFVRWESSYALVWDYLSYWSVFALSMIVCRGLTDALSRSKVRFKKPVDVPGGIFCALWTAWVVVCFTAMTMHTAPLDRNYMGGAFQPTPESKMFFGLAPDRQWLAFIHKQSLGGLCASPVNEFDKKGEFIQKYGERRYQSEKYIEIRLK